MTNQREILRLTAMGLTQTEIASSCNCGRNTVSRTLKRAHEENLDWEKAKSMSEEEVNRILFKPRGSYKAKKMPDYDYVFREMQKSGVSLLLLWLEYCEQCRSEGLIPYQSSQFNYYYSEYIQKHKATMHLNHKPGDEMQVDWAGQTASVINSDTGEIMPAYIFVAVLPYSGYTYVEAFPDEKQESWIEAHVNAYFFFGGVTRILKPDNLKTGIVKNSKTETVVNRTYQEMAEHYGTAILPARPKSPKDKAAVEGTVGNISTWILAAIRNIRCFSFYELNQLMKEKLKEFNTKPFQKKEGSRAMAFEDEKTFLLPLPEIPFEMATWKVATVMFNYHICIEKQNYSVPYEYIRQKVDVRLTKRTVEIFFKGTRVASHPRLYGYQNQYSTMEMHMPDEHRSYQQWSGTRFISWANKIGENTAAVIRHFLTSHPVEQQGYKSCMALLKLTDKYPTDRLESACRRALSFTPSPSYKIIASVLKSGQDRIKDSNIAGKTDTHKNASAYSFTRGAEYYRRNK